MIKFKLVAVVYESRVIGPLDATGHVAFRKESTMDHSSFLKGRLCASCECGPVAVDPRESEMNGADSED